MKLKKGFVRWYDKLSKEGMIQCLESGKNYYFNNWSFKNTQYKVTGICKTTGRKKTVMSKTYPGLFLDYQVIDDKVCQTLEYGMTVNFTEFDPQNERWAINVTLNKALKSEFEDYVSVCLIDSYLAYTQKSHWCSWTQNQSPAYFAKKFEAIYAN